MFTSNDLKSEPTLSILIATKWVQKQTIHANQIGLAHSTIITSENRACNSDELKRRLNVPVLRHMQLQDLDVQSDFMTALKRRNNPLIFKKYIAAAYNKCCTIKQSKTLQSTDKIFVYSLLISSGFIYYSDCSNQYIKGLKKIYDILTDMNNDNQLKKDLNDALESKIYWTDIERKLINTVIHFAVRINIFIQTIQEQIMDIMAEDDEKQRDLQYLIGIGWIPRYYDGYYFGKISRNTYKYPKLSVKHFRNVMKAEKTPNRIYIDDLVIHTHDLADTGLYIVKHSESMHHWFSSTDWIDFEYVDKFRIYVKMINNGRSYSLNVNLYDTIKTVKNEIHKKEGVPMAMLRVQYNNQRLIDGLTLYDYNISQDCCLNVSLLTFNPFLNWIS